MSARILIVDDIPANLKLLEAKLSSEYYQVIIAHNGIEAIEKSKKESPDIILLDVMMPGMDGFETCRRLKAQPETMHIPIVMVTALSDTTDRVRGLEAGADEFITKPVRDLPLFARVRSLVRLKTLMDAYHVREDTTVGLGALRQITEERERPKGTIAILADESMTAITLKRILEKDGHSIVVFDFLEEALSAIPDGNFDVVITPLRMRGDDALRACVQLRNQEKTRHLPILMMAEEDDEQTLIKALELGINDYIMRPIDAQELRARVITQIRRLRYQERLRKTYQSSINLALTDELTQLYNRRYFNAHIDNILSTADREHRSTTLLFVDIDHFKKINDVYGHDAGDKVLIDLSNKLKHYVRDADFLARLGGEEFAVILHDTKTGIALQVAERLRRAVESAPFILPSGEEIKITISVGVACTRDIKGINKTTLLKVADQALYKAKRSGRNRVVVGSFDPPAPPALTNP
ncbi:MAG: PleD family two-component system response regulator [Holosporales bacterium]